MGTLFFIKMAGRWKLRQNMHLGTVVCELAYTYYATGTVGLLTLICLVIDYHVNKDTPVLVFMCVQPSKHLYHF